MESRLKNRNLVDNGLSLNSTTVREIKFMKGGSDVRCILSLENWSMYTLLDVEVNTECGALNPAWGARNVFPGYREVLVAQQSNPLIGTCGTISWQVVEIDIRLIVMWSVPFNFNLRDSYYAIGMVYQKGKFSTSAYWFNQMYYGNNSAYTRSKAGQPVTFSNSRLVVHGFMEAFTYHSILNISVLPQRSYNLAESVQRKLNTKHQADYVVSNSAVITSSSAVKSLTQLFIAVSLNLAFSS
ncbi:tereporin-Ts1 [Eurytemora carolleeae]|uniref:tereporin-Ts1 n=1 Tax=Eurytemora carolleeae TaxID=1294199 RepID=UPI000C75D37C|nr:tereporin-Ts1 [Eurytemora carolleeae]|eukprot:XP_023334518.1 tereporin-Ts1-like [Eurytemora affinis]